MFTAEIEGESELRARWGQAYGAIRRSAVIGVTRAVKQGADEARTKHTFQNQSGRLERSIEGFSIGWVSHETFVGTIRAGAGYASYVEYDTRPHEIRVRRAVWLHWEQDGDHHFAKRVRHPGTKGQPFMGLAYFKAERVLMRELEMGIVLAQRAVA